MVTPVAPATTVAAMHGIGSNTVAAWLWGQPDGNVDSNTLQHNAGVMVT